MVIPLKCTIIPLKCILIPMYTLTVYNVTEDAAKSENRIKVSKCQPHPVHPPVLTLLSITGSDQSLSPAPKHRPRRTHALSTPRARASSAHRTFPPYDHVSSVASALGRVLAWGQAREASTNIDFGGGGLKVRGFRARTPRTPGFCGEEAEGSGRGGLGVRLQALPSGAGGGGGPWGARLGPAVRRTPSRGRS
ncbi:unnamed protein product [Rangifer tarandus platyrhynchus]|uniref:Uncharacterized protein n=1 Tax=Rangifer tarandus platyrhynchus TaxID=3082113 RepID=A0ACB1KHG9_RANTA